MLSGLALAEELLPGTDFIPTATIGWLLENTDFGRNFNGKAEGSAGPAGRRDFGGGSGECVVEVDARRRLRSRYGGGGCQVV